MSWNAHGLVLSYWQKKWKKSQFWSNLRISQKSIPMLQIVIKHLKLSLFVCFLREAPFLCSLLDGCCCFSPQVVGLLLQRAAFQLCGYLYWILDDIFQLMLMKTKGSRWLGIGIVYILSIPIIDTGTYRNYLVQKYMMRKVVENVKLFYYWTLATVLKFFSQEQRVIFLFVFYFINIKE